MKKMNKKEIKKIIESVIKGQKNIAELDETIDFIESGFLDSFDIISLICRIEEKFKIKIEGEEILPGNLNSVESIANWIIKYLR